MLVYLLQALSNQVIPRAVRLTSRHSTADLCFLPTVSVSKTVAQLQQNGTVSNYNSTYRSKMDAKISDYEDSASSPHRSVFF